MSGRGAVGSVEVGGGSLIVVRASLIGPSQRPSSVCNRDLCHATLGLRDKLDMTVSQIPQSGFYNAVFEISN